MQYLLMGHFLENNDNVNAQLSIREVSSARLIKFNIYIGIVIKLLNNHFVSAKVLCSNLYFRTIILGEQLTRICLTLYIAMS